MNPLNEKKKLTTKKKEKDIINKKPAEIYLHRLLGFPAAINAGSAQSHTTNAIKSLN